MYDLRDKESKNTKSNTKLILKWKWQFIFILLIIFIMFFPEQTGTVIGTWVSDFFGTIFNIIKNG